MACLYCIKRWDLIGAGKSRLSGIIDIIANNNRWGFFNPVSPNFITIKLSITGEYSSNELMTKSRITNHGPHLMCLCPVFTYPNIYPYRHPKLPGLFHLFFYDPRKLINLTFMDFK